MTETFKFCSHGNSFVFFTIENNSIDTQVSVRMFSGVYLNSKPLLY